MSLVLAIQPDDDQAARLKAACRRVGAELVIAPTAPQAIAALGSRVPDLILSAPLLPASDEAAVAAHLRELGPDALHVQALTAPVLGEPGPEAPAPRGLLGFFWKQAPRSATPAVCEENVFVEQLSGHLLRAIVDRAALSGESFEEVIARTAVETPSARAPEEPAEIELSAFLEFAAGDNRAQETIAAWVEDERPVARRRQQGKRRQKHRRVVDDSVSFDPAQSDLATLIEALDEFTRDERNTA